MAQQWGSLSKNLDWLREQFGGSVDFYVKEAQLCGARCAVCLCDDLAGIEIAWNMLLRPLQYEKECFEDGEALLQYLSTASGVAFSPTPVKTLEDVFAHLSAGNGVFLADGAGQAFSFAAQSFAQRSPGEPDSEVNVYGLSLIHILKEGVPARRGPARSKRRAAVTFIIPYRPAVLKIIR